MISTSRLRAPVQKLVAISNDKQSIVYFFSTFGMQAFCLEAKYCQKRMLPIFKLYLHYLEALINVVFSNNQVKSCLPR